MNLDLHVHAALSKALGFELTFIREMIAGARANGLDTIAFTEHGGTRNFDEIIPTLDYTLAYIDPHYRAGDLRILPGIEVGSAEGPHLVAVGNRTAIRTFHARLLQLIEAGTGVPVRTFFAHQAGLELVSILAHPLRPGRELERIDPDLIGQFDALELNARDLYVLGDAIEADTVALGRVTGLPVFAGSDSHQRYQLGSVTNLMDNDVTSITDLKARIRAGAVTRHIHPDLNTKVAMAREAKDRIKSRLHVHVG